MTRLSSPRTDGGSRVGSTTTIKKAPEGFRRHRVLQLARCGQARGVSPASLGQSLVRRSLAGQRDRGIGFYPPNRAGVADRHRSRGRIQAGCQSLRRGLVADAGVHRVRRRPHSHKVRRQRAHSNSRRLQRKLYLVSGCNHSVIRSRSLRQSCGTDHALIVGRGPTTRRQRRQQKEKQKRKRRFPWHGDTFRANSINVSLGLVR
jgi:hypothetical protein